MRNLCWTPADKCPPRDALDRVDFDDPEVIAAIEKAAREYKPDAETLRRLKQFESTVPSVETMLMILP